MAFTAAGGRGLISIVLGFWGFERGSGRPGRQKGLDENLQGASEQSDRNEAAVSHYSSCPSLDSTMTGRHKSRLARVTNAKHK
jgi:hypothetical protein